MTEALVGFFGVFIGILLSEYFRRNSRIENYSAQVFEKKLSIYEGLMTEIQRASSVITALHDNTELTIDTKREVASKAGMKVLDYSDKHKFYLDEEIAVHCCLAFVGVSDIFEEDNDEDELTGFRQAVKEAYSMIRIESGVAKLDGLFRSITKSSPGSSLIQCYRVVKTAYEKNIKIKAE